MNSTIIADIAIPFEPLKLLQSLYSAIQHCRSVTITDKNGKLTQFTQHSIKREEHSIQKTTFKVSICNPAILKNRWKFDYILNMLCTCFFLLKCLLEVDLKLWVKKVTRRLWYSRVSKNSHKTQLPRKCNRIWVTLNKFCICIIYTWDHTETLHFFYLRWAFIYVVSMLFDLLIPAYEAA